MNPDTDVESAFAETGRDTDNRNGRKENPMPKRIKRALDNAATAGAHADATLAKADIILAEIGDLIDAIRDGVEIELTISGRKIPATLKIKP